MATNFHPDLAAHADVDARAAFIMRTYTHLVGAIFAFAGLEALLLHSPIAPSMLDFITGGRWNAVLLMGAFIVSSWIADGWARSATAPAMQYAGLGLYVVAEAFIFLPILFFVRAKLNAPDLITSAGLITAITFAGLTFVVFLTRKDFSFMRAVLGVAGIMAFALVLCAAIFGLTLGVWFSVAMIGLAAGYILYDTSNVLHHYRTDQHVSAALALFASVALLFWYVLRLLMSRRD